MLGEIPFPVSVCPSQNKSECPRWWIVDEPPTARQDRDCSRRASGVFSEYHDETVSSCLSPGRKFWT